MKQFLKELNAEFGPVKMQGKRSVTTHPSGHELDSAPLLRAEAYTILLGLAVLLAGCGNPQESARKELAKLGKDFNAAAFIESVANGDKLAVKLFLDAGINVNEPEKNGTTVLMIASLRGDREAVQEFLKRGANPNLQDNNGTTALMAASSRGDPQTVQMLLNKGANPNLQKHDGITALGIAATAGNADIVAALLAKDADPNVVLTSNLTKGVTPLIAAAMGGHVETTRLLLKKGADVNAKDSNGFTAADYATNVYVVRLLREQGAPVVTDYDLKSFLDQFRRDLASQARRDMENGNTPDACRKLIAETLSIYEEDRFTSNQLFQARTCAFDALGSAIQSFALSTVTSGIDLAREKAKPFMKFREELGKEIARHN